MDYSFKIINSSAGSGKTFNLAIEFISKLLQNKDDDHFKSMLALSFTNKASVEMKDRILAYLNDLKLQQYLHDVNFYETVHLQLTNN